MYTKSNPASPPVPPKNYSGTMYQSPPPAPTLPPTPPPKPAPANPPENRPDERPCESCKFAPPPQEGCAEKKPGLLSGLFGEGGINIGTEELLLIGLILLLYSNGADNDVIVMLAIVLLAGFI